MQGFISKRKPNEHEAKLRVGNDAEVDVEAVEVVSLKLESGFQLVLENFFYIPSFRRNLVYVLIMDKIGYWFNIHNGKVNIFLDSQSIGHCILSHNLYQLSLHFKY